MYGEVVEGGRDLGFLLDQAQTPWKETLLLVCVRVWAVAHKRMSPIFCSYVADKIEDTLQLRALFR